MAPKLRIAWFSELNCQREPGPAVAAYWSDQLLPLLRQDFEIDLFHNSFAEYPGYPTYHYLTAFRRQAEKPYDLFFYQLEDRVSSDFVRIHLALQPGVVLFHDFLFTRFGPEQILNSPWERVVAKYRGQGPWPERDCFNPPRGPQGFREAAFAELALFANPVQLGQFKGEVAARAFVDVPGLGAASIAAPVAVDPHIPASSPQRMRVAYAGSPQIEDRAHKLLPALAELKDCRLSWLLAEEERGRAVALLQEFGLTDVELILGRTPQRWYEVVRNTDISVHTSFSAFRHTGPYLPISLMAGRPTIVTNFGAATALPDGVVFKIEPGETECAQLADLFGRLSQMASFRAAGAIQEFARDQFDRKIVAAEIGFVFKQTAAAFAAEHRKWQAFLAEAGAAQFAERGALWKGDRSESGLAGESGELIWKRLLQPVYRELGWMAAPRG